jgi:hypothetical protein
MYFYMCSADDVNINNRLEEVDSLTTPHGTPGFNEFGSPNMRSTEGPAIENQSTIP